MPVPNVIEKFSQSTAALIVDPNGVEVSAVNPLPVASTAANEALVLGYTGSKLTSVTKTVSGTTYTRTLTYTGDLLTEVSEWVEV